MVLIRMEGALRDYFILNNALVKEGIMFQTLKRNAILSKFLP